MSVAYAHKKKYRRNADIWVYIKRLGYLHFFVEKRRIMWYTYMECRLIYLNKYYVAF